ncbi:MAG: NTP transferase domain-containing protein [Polyangiaceae bacterium]
MSNGPVNDALTIGLFVGGAGKRMGGVAKGLLLVPDGSETLIARLLRLCRSVAPSASIYLVGEASAYAGLGLPALSDEPTGIGPLGGLRGLLLRAQSEGSRAALALACDLPFLEQSVLSALTAPLTGAARVPFVEAFFQPLAAAYEPTATLQAIDRSRALGKHALLYVLQILGERVERFEIDGAQAHTLRDWDTPEDVRG